MEVKKPQTQTGGRPATSGHIPGCYSLAVGMPDAACQNRWKWTPLTDVARLESGHTPSRKHPEYWGGDIPWIGIRDATGNHGRTLYDTEQHTNDLGIYNSSARVLPANTVCLSRTASVGYVVVMGRPMATSQDFVNWVCSDEIYYDFLKYILLSEKRSFLQFASGTTHQTIYFPEVKAFHVCLPPVPIQRKIAGVLSAYDDLIENNTRRIAILEAMARAIYREWFVEFRSPGHEKVKLVNSPLGKIPEGWKATTVGDVVVNFDRLRKPLSSMQRANIKGAYPYYGAAKIFDHINDYIFDGKYLLVAEDGSVITTDRKPVLQMAYGKFWVNNHTHILQGKAPVSTEHLYLSLSLTDVSGYVTGAAQPKITQANMNRMPFIVATDDVEQAFIDLALSIFDEINLLNRKTANLRKTRDLLLPKLISGQLDVEELDIETGEPLVEAEA